MLTGGIVPPPELTYIFGLSAPPLIYTLALPDALPIWLPKLSWLWMVIGPPVGLEVAAKLKAELVKTSLLAAAAVTVTTWVGVGLKASLAVAAMVGVPALLASQQQLTLFTLLEMLTEGIVPPP